MNKRWVFIHSCVHPFERRDSIQVSESKLTPACKEIHTKHFERESSDCTRNSAWQMQCRCKSNKDSSRHTWCGANFFSVMSIVYTAWLLSITGDKMRYFFQASAVRELSNGQLDRKSKCRWQTAGQNRIKEHCTFFEGESEYIAWTLRGMFWPWCGMLLIRLGQQSYM